MKNKKFLFFVNGNTKIGLGHVYRSINIASALSNRGHEVFFVTQNRVAFNLISKKFNCKFSKKINSKQNFLFFQNFSPDLIVLDKLKETKSYLQFYKKLGNVLTIDYIGNHTELITYGINFLYQKSNKIKNSFSGFQYATINQYFSINQNFQIKKDVKSIIILQGGADTYCFIPKIISSLDSIPTTVKISVVVGPSFKCWKELKKAIKLNSTQISVMKNVEDMKSLMSKNDLAITAAGNTVLELACLGIPSIIVCGEKFENETANMLVKNNFGINLGFGKNVSKQTIANSTIKLMNDFEKRKSMRRIGRKLIDGKGTLRVAKLLEKLSTKKLE